MNKVLGILLLISAFWGWTSSVMGQESRLTQGPKALYEFENGSGSTVTEVSRNFAARPLLLQDPQTVYVATTGSDMTGDGTQGNPYRTIRKGMIEAFDGDTVLLADGLYTGEGNRDLDFSQKKITVASETGIPEACIIDCESAPGLEHNGFWFHSDEDTFSVVKDVLIQNADRAILIGLPGYDMNSTEDEEPAGPRIDNCDLENNEVGVEILDYGSFVLVQDCRIQANGTGILFDEDADQVSDGDPDHTSRIEYCNISLNTGSGVKTAGSYTCFQGLFLIGNDITENGENGIHHSTYFGEIQVFGGTLSGNGGHGIRSVGQEDGRLTVASCLINGNLTGGVLTGFDAFPTITECDIFDNRGVGLELPVNFRVQHVNSYSNDGDGIKVGWDGRTSVENRTPIDYGIFDCNVYDNGGTGLFIGSLAPNDLPVGGLNSCNNAGGGLFCSSQAIPGFENNITLSNSTIVNNPFGIHITGDVPILVDHSIIAFNQGLSIECSDLQAPAVTCSDIYGNSSGDWVGCIAGLDGFDGNISLDPLFCDFQACEPTILFNSPCLPENHPDGPGCGLIGAMGSCSIPEPDILSVTDVGNDQGRQVRVSWSRSDFDALDSPTPITEYGIYRREDQFATSSSVSSDQCKLAGWDFLDVVPARGDEEYQFIAPTLCDSTITSGMCWSVFMVSAMTAQPLVFYDSSPDSGYSVDNLAPGIPSSIIVEYVPGGVFLDWDDAPEPDFKLYRIYGSSTPDFLPSPDTLIQETTASQWTHIFSRDWGLYYKITALDFAGNEGEAGSPGDVSAVGNDSVPARTALLGAVPNPFNPSTKLSFEMATAGHARLKVYDPAGRLVVTLVDESFESGIHDVVWNGRDSSGRRSAAGVYLYRLEVGGFIETKRMVLVK